MSESLSRKVQMACLWGGPFSLFMIAVGFCLLAGMVPPPTPGDSAREIQQMYADNTDLIRLGFFLSMLGAGFQVPFSAVVSIQMRRIEGRVAPLAITQFGVGAVGVLLIIFPIMIMQAAAFRPNRDPQLILLLNDLAWLPFVGIISLFIVQNLVIAAASFIDTDEVVFPRWIGYLCAWVVVLTLPAGLIYFFKSGAFAWSGIFPFWIPLTVFFVWFMAIFLVVRKAVLSEELEVQPT